MHHGPKAPCLPASHVWTPLPPLSWPALAVSVLVYDFKVAPMPWGARWFLPSSLLRYVHIHLGIT